MKEFISLWLALTCFHASASAENQDLKLQLAQTSTESRIVIGSKTSKIYALLYNSSQRDINVWQFGTSYGMTAFTIEVFDRQKIKLGEIKNTRTSWVSDWLAKSVVKPGHHQIFPLPVDLNNRWELSGALADFPLNVWHDGLIKVKYKVRLDHRAKKFNVWTGSLSSDYSPYKFRISAKKEPHNQAK